ncbi:hypothetical protein DTO282E5_1328 [Paecilomyces variotii]|nr:hypothetical protein DTO282E5_1328 [Paecilomyces variotii]
MPIGLETSARSTPSSFDEHRLRRMGNRQLPDSHFERFVEHHFSCGHICMYYPRIPTLIYVPHIWKRNMPCPSCAAKMSFEYISRRKYERSIRYKAKAWFRRIFKNNVKMVDPMEWQWAE